MYLSSRVPTAPASGGPTAFGRLAASIVASVAVMVAPFVASTASAAERADSPGLEALESFRQPQQQRRAVENRFFLKEGRFEISPIFGYVPNNPFAVRYAGGAIVGYHFSEAFSAQAMVTYAHDGGEGDLKGLTEVLLRRAATGAGDKEFQQPLDKVGLSASFGVAYAPLYGKINLVGETVLNFDLYGFAGIGMVAKHNYFARYDHTADPEAGDIVRLEPAPEFNEVKVAPVIGIGQNYFLNQLMSVKLDARASFFVDNKPQYDATVPVSEQRLYNNFMISAGLGFFFPKMKPRLYNF